MKIAALYCRVSTDRQEQEATIESQIDEVEARIRADGNYLKENLKFVDDGWSGELIVRPALDAMRDAASRREFEVLYVYDRGRLSRKFAYQELVLDELYDKSIEFVTLHDVNALTAEERVLQAMQGVFHEYERVKIAERMRRGKLYKVKNGILFGWQAPYGLKSVKVNEQTQFEIDEHEAEVVKMIFEMVGNQCFTVRQVIKRLHEQNIPPRRSKKGTWSTSTLSRLLRDETYIGVTYYNKKEGVIPLKPTKQDKYKKIKKSSRKVRPKDEWYPLQVPKIVPDVLFQKVQKQLEINNQFAMRNKKNEYLLSGLVYCSCGKKRSGEGNSKNGHLYYRCTDRILRYPMPKECRAMGVNAPILDKLVLETVYKLLTDHRLIERQAERLSKIEVKESRNHTNADQLKLKQLKDEGKRYLKVFGEGIITIEQYKEQIKELEAKKAIITAKVTSNSLTQSPEYILPSNIQELCDKISKILIGLTTREKEFVLRRVIEEVSTDGKTATIRGTLPIDKIESEVYAKNVKFWSISRDSRVAKRGEVDVV